MLPTTLIAALLTRIPKGPWAAVTSSMTRSMASRSPASKGRPITVASRMVRGDGCSDLSGTPFVDVGDDDGGSTGCQSAHDGLADALPGGRGDERDLAGEFLLGHLALPGRAAELRRALLPM